MTPTPEEARALVNTLLENALMSRMVGGQSNIARAEFAEETAAALTAAADEVERLTRAIKTMKTQAQGTPNHLYCAKVIETAREALKGGDQ